MTTLAIDREQIAAFVGAMFPYASDGVNIALRAFHEGQTKPFRVAHTKVNGTGVDGISVKAIEVAAEAARNAEPIVFCPPIAGFGNVLEPWKAREADLCEAYSLSVECDARAAAARRGLESLLGPATVIVASGGEWTDPETGEIEPKLHLHWRLSEPATGDDLAKLKVARRAATSIVGGDPTSISAVHPMRWPGSVHRKGTPRLAQIVAHNQDVEIELGEAAERLAEAAGAMPRHEGAKGSSGQRGEPGDGGEYETLVANILRGESLHNSLDRLAAKMVGSGMDGGAVVLALRGMMQASHAPRDARWKARYDDIWRDVSTAEAKFKRPVLEKGAEGSSQPVKALGWAQAYQWRDPSTIPPREWLYGDHFIRKFVTLTMAPGGIGKSALLLAEAVAMASGKPILGSRPADRLRVWYWNGEDPLEETERRVAALALRCGLSRDDLEGFLFIGSGRDADLIIGEQTRDGAQINGPNVAAISALIADLRIDLAIIDPFVSSHRVTENDNGAIDRVAKTWGRIADTANAGIELVHHTRKRVNPNDEITVEDGRGAVALLAAARSARALNGMTDTEAANAGVQMRRAYFRVDNGKANLAPPPEGSTWYKFESQLLGNGGLEGGDSVGVVTPWTWPDALASVQVSDLIAVQRKVHSGAWRENVQAADWVGYAVAEALGCDATDKAQKARIKSLLKIWLTSGALTIVSGRDAKGNSRPFVEVGNWVSETVETET